MQTGGGVRESTLSMLVQPLGISACPLITRLEQQPGPGEAQGSTTGTRYTATKRAAERIMGKTRGAKPEVRAANLKGLRSARSSTTPLFSCAGQGERKHSSTVHGLAQLRRLGWARLLGRAIELSL